MDLNVIKKHLSELGLPTDMLPDDKLKDLLKMAEEQVNSQGNVTQPKKNPKRGGLRIKPNEKCLCGSNIKYKKCCGSYEKVNKN